MPKPMAVAGNDPNKKIVPIYGEQGLPGTKIFGGQIFEEYLTDLQGVQGLEIYDKMRRSDAQVAGALELIKLPILQAKWNIVANVADEEQGEEIANFVRFALFGQMEYTWEYTLSQALLMLDFGFSPLEKVWELRPMPEGMEETGLSGEAIWLKKISPRMPNTIREWEMDPKTNDLKKVKQMLPDGEEKIIDRTKLAMFVHHKEGDNWEGRSVLRPAYKHWYIKDTLEKIDAIGHERTSLGIPYFEIQEGYAYDPDSDEGRALITRLEEIARHLRANEESFVIMPPGVTFDLKSLGQDNKSLLQSIQHHDLHIMVNILGQFMTLGMTGSGSRAVAEQQRGPFDLELLAIATNVATTFEREVIRELVEFNYGPRPGYPQLVAKGVTESNKSQQALATMIAQLCQYGVIVPDEELENWIREMLGLPTKVPMDLTGTDVVDKGAVTEEGSILDNNPTGDLEPGPTEGPEITTNKKMPDSTGYSADPEDKLLFWREPTISEQFVAFEEIHYELETNKRRFMTVAGAKTYEVVDRLAAKAAEYVAKGDTRSLSRMGVDSKDIKALASIINKQVYVPLSKYGAQTVRDEKARAQTGLPVRRTAPPIEVEAPLEPVAYQEDYYIENNLRSYQEARALAMATAILTQTLNVIRSQAMRIVRTASFDVPQALQRQAESTADVQIRAAANDTVAEAFDMGRATEIQNQVATGDVRYAIYSALLDRNVCEACLRRDGQVYTPEQPEFYEFMDGNAEECYGGSRCRCVLILGF